MVADLVVLRGAALSRVSLIVIWKKRVGLHALIGCIVKSRAANPKEDSTRTATAPPPSASFSRFRRLTYEQQKTKNNARQIRKYTD